LPGTVMGPGGWRLIPPRSALPALLRYSVTIGPRSRSCHSWLQIARPTRLRLPSTDSHRTSQISPVEMSRMTTPVTMISTGSQTKRWSCAARLRIRPGKTVAGLRGFRGLPLWKESACRRGQREAKRPRGTTRRAGAFLTALGVLHEVAHASRGSVRAFAAAAGRIHQVGLATRRSAAVLIHTSPNPPLVLSCVFQQRPRPRRDLCRFGWCRGGPQLTRAATATTG
jgi:hypothetical protein